MQDDVVHGSIGRKIMLANQRGERRIVPSCMHEYALRKRCDLSACLHVASDVFDCSKSSHRTRNAQDCHTLEAEPASFHVYSLQDHLTSFLTGWSHRCFICWLGIAGTSMEQQYCTYRDLFMLSVLDLCCTAAWLMACCDIASHAFMMDRLHLSACCPAPHADLLFALRTLRHRERKAGCARRRPGFCFLCRASRAP